VRFSNPFAEAFRRKPYEPKEPKTVAVGLVSHVRQFVRDDGSFAFFRGGEERGRRIHAYDVIHPPESEEARDAETRLKVIGGAAELLNPNVSVEEFRK